MDPMRAANRLASDDVFNWALISAKGTPLKLTCGLELQVDSALSGQEHGDVLFVVAGFNTDLHAPASTLPKIKKIAEQHATVCAIEAGAWVLARAGVLNDHTVTTHWEDLENLAFAFPRLNVVNQRFVIDRNIWSTGGASPTLDMLLHYLRVNERQSLALDVANVFIHNETPGNADLRYTAPVNWLDRAAPKLASAIRIMDDHIETPLRLPSIAAKVGISMRSLQYLAIQHLGIGPGEYYLRLRLQAARRLVLDTRSSMLEIALRTGFSNSSSLTRAFKKRYHDTPSNLRNGTRFDQVTDSGI